MEPRSAVARSLVIDMMRTPARPGLGIGDIERAPVLGGGSVTEGAELALPDDARTPFCLSARADHAGASLFGPVE